MGRPKAVNINTFPQYNLLHTEKTKMYSGVSGTTLYPIKETKEFYRSIEIWTSSASTFKAKKKNVKLNVDIPVITDGATKLFLAKHCWKDWVKKQLAKGSKTMEEATTMLKRIFPDKELVYFYELDSLIGAYHSGNFESFDKDGNPEVPNQHAIANQKYYNSKYNKFCNQDVPEIKALFEAYTNETDEKKKSELFTKYYNADEEYSFKHNNIIPQLTDVGRHAVCYPVAFTNGTADWYKEKFGKTCPYAHAGEIIFVTTNVAVYFEIKRHY